MFHGKSYFAPHLKLDSNIWLIFKAFFTVSDHTLSMQVGGSGGGGARILQIFKEKFVAQETIDLSISRPGNFFRKYFMAPPISFSFLFKAYL